MNQEQLIDKMVAIMIEKEMHEFWFHGAGFCQKCGELRKRCECLEFTEYTPCDNKTCKFIMVKNT